MRSIAALLLCCVIVSATDAPLPNQQELKERTLRSLKASEKELEKYSCTVRSETDELNSDGSIKKRKTADQERFFVNGVEVNHDLTRDGKPLSAEAAKKEQDRVNYEVKKYSDLKNVQKREAEDEKEIDTFLRALKFNNERREVRDGRNTIVFDLAGDPSYHAKKLEDKFAVAMVGRIWIDEETGNIDELRAHTEKDVKIGGGFIASLHKGFRIALVQQRMPDGIWIEKMVEGIGEARAAIFFHPRFRFHEDLDKCHLFAVDTHQSVQSPPPTKP